MDLFGGCPVFSGKALTAPGSDSFIAKNFPNNATQHLNLFVSYTQNHIFKNILGIINVTSYFREINSVSLVQSPGLDQLCMIIAFNLS